VTARIRLPGRAEPLIIPSPGWADRYPPPVSRRVYAAAHVAALPGGEVIDWESTMRFRDHLWAHGFGVAEAMDTAQRGMGLSWGQARELIARSAERAVQYRANQNRSGKTEAGADAAGGNAAGADAARGNAAGADGRLVCGVGTDQLRDGERHSIARIISAYEEQMTVVQAAGAGAVLMASRALAASAKGARDYLDVYGELLGQAKRPVIVHWLGEAFDPALRGYWGSGELGSAADTVLSLIETADGRVDGVKLSVLDAGFEVALRRRLPDGVRLYTGDDFNYAELILGDDRGHSDALLGAFAAITGPAAAALAALDRGDLDGYSAAIAPTVPLSRLLFEQPTYHYKVGVAFLAWLNGLQPHFAMLGGLERQRPIGHLIRVFELAAAARALAEPELAAERMSRLLDGRYG
jgi:Protein of unknown function (DUF993)